MQALIPDDVASAVVLYVVTQRNSAAIVITRKCGVVVGLSGLDNDEVSSIQKTWAKWTANGIVLDPIMSTYLPHLLRRVSNVAVLPLLRPAAAWKQTGNYRFRTAFCTRSQFTRALSNDDRYLLDEFEIVYSPSLSILWQCRQRAQVSGELFFSSRIPTLDLRFAAMEGRACASH